MSRLDRVLKRLVQPEYHYLLDSPGLIPRLRAIALIGLRFIWAWVAVLVLGIVVTVSAGMDIYHRTEVPRFCAACHEMGSNFGSWEASLHKSIKCIDCHARPGLTGWVAAKMGGMRQLVQHFSAAEISDIKVNDGQKLLVSENCVRCHSGATRLQERKGIRIEHAKHLKITASCVRCHSHKFAHPPYANGQVKSSFSRPVPLVDPKDCFSCHNGGKESGVVAFDAADQANCTRCHIDGGLASSHGGGGFTCLDCHDKKEPEHYPISAGGVGSICAKCHDAAITKSDHVPVAEGNCDACHRVMSPSHLFVNSAQPTASVCMQCHGDQFPPGTSGPSGGATSATTTSGFANGKTNLHHLHNEMLADAPDWCLRCHEPHPRPGMSHMVRLVDAEQKLSTKPARATGVFRSTKDGGTCTGACHGKTTVSYKRTGAGGT